jgi:hypothetical protein
VKAAAIQSQDREEQAAEEKVEMLAQEQQNRRRPHGYISSESDPV